MSGIYFHIPFCKQACTYCDFHFSTTFHVYREQLVSALQQELVSRKSEIDASWIESVYFGGGTPSLLSHAELLQLMLTVRQNVQLHAHAEITLEANPDDISKEKLLEWKGAGINRLSIGVQSFLKDDLDWMNRAHNVDQAHLALSLAKELGFEVSVDLMYGLPAASLEQWKSNLDMALRYRPEHISAYCLTVEQKTIVYQWVKQQKISVASDEEQSEQFEMLVQILREHGYEQYEISNFCRDGKYAVHNSNYWKAKPYLGIGPSAHSFDGTSRRWNVSNNRSYIKGVESREGYFEQEQLQPLERFNEYIMIGLRTIWGVDMKRLHDILPLPLVFLDRIDSLRSSGHLQSTNGCLVLTEKGKLLADYIASELFLLKEG